MYCTFAPRIALGLPSAGSKSPSAEAFPTLECCVKLHFVSRPIVEDLIQQYADHLRTERNVSPHTLRNYLSDLAQFHNFLRERELCVDSTDNVDVQKVDILVVRAFLAALSQDRKKSSIGRKLAALKGFFRYLIANGSRKIRCC